MNCVLPCRLTAFDKMRIGVPWLVWRRFLKRSRNAMATAMVAWLVLITPAHAQCSSPVPGGDPNGNSCPGVASAPAGGADAGGGNPINVMTGNKYQREDDLPALPGVLGLEIVRHYNSAYAGPSHPNGVLGRGWRLSYETELVDRFGKLQVLQADGGRVIFDRDKNAPTGCSTRNPANGTMSLGRQPDGRLDYTWTWTDGRKLHFNAAGKLDKVSVPSGETLRLIYDSQNVLVRVIDPQGRILNLAYFERTDPNQFHGVRFIDTPVGRFAYEYGSTVPKGAGLIDKRQLLANLVRVRLPDQFEPDLKAHALSSRGTTRSTTGRLYHHEDPRSPWLMTGISVESTGTDGRRVSTRYATYGYDDTERAILSTHADNVDKITLDNSKAGQTVLTNSLGQKTVYRYAVISGEYRLLEVRGAGCALCGEPNIHYGYNTVGQLTEMTKLSENGEAITTIKTERDKLGRVRSVSKLFYQNGKPGPAQLRVRFAYRGSAFVPELIARPSVVASEEMVTRVDYNDAGQLLRVTDSGWIPAYDGKRPAARIERTTSYAYTTINGHSLLTQIDGPLPNGKTNSPADSDVIILEYDHSNVSSPGHTAGALSQYERHNGLLTRVIAPGELTTEILERDAALRPTKLRTLDGGIAQTTSITNDWRGAALHIETVADTLRRNLNYEYNALGKVAAVTMPGKLRTTFTYDRAGRHNLTVLPDGSGISSEQNTEDRVVRMARHLDALVAGSPILAELRFAYDNQTDKPSKLAEVNDATGVINRNKYDDFGHISMVHSGLGIATAFSYNQDGLLNHRTDAVESTDAASIGLTYDPAGHATSITAGNGVKTTRRYDDFGRKVMEADPDRGVTLFRHDKAGRVVVRIDETMIATRFAYDHANRLVAVGADSKPNLVQYRYRGTHLLDVIDSPDGSVAHPTERTVYERDAFGRVIKETRWLANVTPKAGGPSGFTFITTSEYDESGRLIKQTLPDGHCLQYRYAANDAERASGDRPGQLKSILFDDRIVVTDIKQTLAGGLTGYTMSNNAHQTVTRDRQGRIQQLLTISNNKQGWWIRLLEWLSVIKPDNIIQYQQFNRYDKGGRLIHIERNIPAYPEPGGLLKNQSKHYDYDSLNRLIAQSDSDGANSTFAYDKAGNRVAEVASLNRDIIQRAYHYSPGTNHLISVTHSKFLADRGATEASTRFSLIKAATTPEQKMQFLSAAWLYHHSGMQLAQIHWAKNRLANRRIIYNSAKRPVTVYENNNIVARYYYNHLGERFAKEIYFPQSPQIKSSQSGMKASTTYSLYSNHRLTAEVDSNNQIKAHFIYLNGTPVAKIEMETNDSIARVLWKTISLRKIPDASDMRSRIYAIVTDHLGTPQQVLDECQRIVWQADTTAFGETHVTYAGLATKPFVMNLRFPGQVFDAETKLNYNYLRDYDPSIGRYTTPDPAGLDGGSNPYVYVSNNPLTNIDPLGLFQSDIHYYMTFFLAVTAGVNPEEARVIALAAQYIDDSPDTAPLNVSLSTGLTDAHRTRLLTYHFTMVPSVIDPATGIISGVRNDPILGYGIPPTDPRYTNIPENEQLNNLSAAVVTAGQATNLINSRCTQLQFFGEYLHAFEDTFAHRDSNDMPFSLKYGLGHATYGSNPDYTYNHIAPLPVPGAFNWNTNEARTLEAEREVFAKMEAWADPNNAKKVSDIEQILRNFNSIHESEGNGESTEERQRGYSNKINLLQSALKDLGYADIDIIQGGLYSFNTGVASDNRKANLHDKNGGKLDQKLYQGTILPQ